MKFRFWLLIEYYKPSSLGVTSNSSSERRETFLLVVGDLCCSDLAVLKIAECKIPHT